MANGKFFLAEADASDVISNPQVEQTIYSGNEGKIVNTLNTALKVAKKNARKMQYKAETGESAGPWTSPNVLIVGPAGCGKTETVMDWARQNNIKLVVKDIKVFSRDTLASVTAVKMNPEGEGGTSITLPTHEFDALNLSKEEIEGTKDGEGNYIKKPYIGSVLFLDEYNRAPDAVRNVLLTLIRNHELDRVNGSERFDQLLFVVAAQNPSVEDGGQAYSSTHRLDPAEINRFPFKIFVDPDPAVTLAWLERVYAQEIKAFSNDEEAQEEAQMKLLAARCFLSDSYVPKEARPQFSGSAEILNQNDAQKDTYTPRSLTDMLEITNGDPDEIRRYWHNQFGKTFHEMELENVLSAIEENGNSGIAANDSKVQRMVGGNQKPTGGVYRDPDQETSNTQSAAPATPVAQDSNQRAANAMGRL